MPAIYCLKRSAYFYYGHQRRPPAGTLPHQLARCSTGFAPQLVGIAFAVFKRLRNRRRYLLGYFMRPIVTFPRLYPTSRSHKRRLNQHTLLAIDHHADQHKPLTRNSTTLLHQLVAQLLYARGEDLG